MRRKEFDRLNERRLELISKKFASKLTRKEQAELKELEKRTSEYFAPMYRRMIRKLEKLKRDAEKSMAESAKAWRELGIK